MIDFESPSTSAPFVVGVDVVEISRIASAIRRHGDRFLERIYTCRELDYCRGRTASLATRFAAKEAIAKALGTGIGVIRWLDVEILCDDYGKPWVLLHGPAHRRAAELGLGHLEVSLSHSRMVAVAVVVMGRANPPR